MKFTFLAHPVNGNPVTRPRPILAALACGCGWRAGCAVVCLLSLAVWDRSFNFTIKNVVENGKFAVFRTTRDWLHGGCWIVRRSDSPKDVDSVSTAYGRSAPQSIRPGSIRPTSAPNAVVPPQVEGRSAPGSGSFRPGSFRPNTPM